MATRRSTGAVRVGVRTLLCGVLLGASGCYHHHVRAEQRPIGRDPSKEGHSEVLWSYVWGAVQEDFKASESCGATQGQEGEALQDVSYHSNFGFALVTVLTIGFASPVTVTWTCAKDPTPVVTGEDPDDPM